MQKNEKNEFKLIQQETTCTLKKRVKMLKSPAGMSSISFLCFQTQIRILKHPESRLRNKLCFELVPLTFKELPSDHPNLKPSQIADYPLLTNLFVEKKFQSPERESI
jgi:hypothetical protein